MSTSIEAEETIKKSSIQVIISRKLGIKENILNLKKGIYIKSTMYSYHMNSERLNDIPLLLTKKARMLVFNTYLPHLLNDLVSTK